MRGMIELKDFFGFKIFAFALFFWVEKFGTYFLGGGLI